MPSGTLTAGQACSVRNFPATLMNELLKTLRISGVSYADNRIDCRKNLALLTMAGFQLLA